ncbi:MAG: excinuclease ABC subunit A [Chitinophagaceae bacterium]|nr:MAG: excinuclease ABC subunit A [Chitinophagaceae bacterium]
MKNHPSANTIHIKGARVHNLQNIEVFIPKGQLVVITGVSGSGKSSLLMDTLFAEGQRRYVESLSSYARQFLNRMNKPDVDFIKGLCPAISIEQRQGSRNSRSTVGTLTELYDYLRLLYARIGKTYSPVSGKEVLKDDVKSVMSLVESFEEGKRFYIAIQFNPPGGKKPEIEKTLQLLKEKGFNRILINNEVIKIEDWYAFSKKNKQLKDAFLIVDRLSWSKEDTDNINRVKDSVENAFFEGNGEMWIIDTEEEKNYFSNRFEADGIIFEEPNPHFFNFNSPYGACKTCEGFGTTVGIDENLIFPDKNMSVYEGAIAPWRGEKMQYYNNLLVRNAIHFDFPVHRSYKHLTDEEKQVLWEGNDYFTGLTAFFKDLENSAYKIQNRVMLSRYRGRKACPDCLGTRLRKDASYVKIDKKSIIDVLLMPLDILHDFFQNIQLDSRSQEIGNRILLEVKNRLSFMVKLGLGYLNLNRMAGSLSGGEIQRIQLTRALGSNLTNSLYILDEPSIGLHPKDTFQLIGVLNELKQLGNTVVVVEHEEEIIRHADYVIDMGPLAAQHGGKVVFSGTFPELMDKGKSLTAEYFRGEQKIEIPANRRKSIGKISIKGAAQFNLKEIDAEFPLNTLTVVTGVSGSGKTTLVKKILYPWIFYKLGGYGIDKPGTFDEISGDVNQIKQVELIDQKPLGKSSRSNPVTYLKAFDHIRDLYAKQKLAAIRNYKPKHFSFNVQGGRCDACNGEGEVTIEMQFLADIHLPCEVCGGKRFKEEVLEVKYEDKNIFDVLEMTVDEALLFFEKKPSIYESILPLQDVGLGYVKLGQSSSTLSGGEAQRVKLASFLGKGNPGGHVMFIFDEPTTGLHFHDVKKLLKAFDALIDNGHTVIVVEHNMDVIKTADWIIDLGPEGGDKGGRLLYQGPPEGLLKIKESYTGKFLQEKF